MLNFKKQVISIAILIILLLSLFPVIGQAAPSASVMIYEAYTAGDYDSGSNQAPYKQCYVVLCNTSENTVDLSGWSLRYSGETSNAIQDYIKVPLTGSISPKHFYVIKGGPCTDPKFPQTSVDLEDAFSLINVEDENLSMIRKSGKIALCDNTIGDAEEITSGSPFVVDFVGYGSAKNVNDYETSPASAPSVKQILRRAGYIDTDNNEADFVIYDFKDNPNDIIYYTPEILAVDSPVIEFSHEAGEYKEEFTLELSLADNADGKIYYTIDGSEPVDSTGKPTAAAIEYENEIRIFDRTAEDSNLMYETGTTQTGTTDVRFLWPPVKNAGESEEDYQARLKDIFTDIFKINTIKAVATSGGRTSKAVTKSFIISDETIQKRFNLPVFSITTDKSSLYDGDTGLFKYPNYEQKGSEWERPAYIEFFEADGSLGFSESVGMRLNGGYTRGYPQKALRFYMTNTLKYDLFDGRVTKADGSKLLEFDRFLLRSAGNDWYSASIRDSFYQNYCKENLGIDSQGYRPCVAFINGEYWGVYDIRERYDDYYFASHYEIATKDVVLVETWNELSEGKAGDEQPLIDLRKFIWDNDMTDPVNYQRFLDEFDIDNYIDYMICMIYSGNTDWPHNNTKMWRNKSDTNGLDKKWRFLMVDCDYAFAGSSGYGHDTLSWAMGKPTMFSGEPEPRIAPARSGEMLGNLMENDDFRNKFAKRFGELLDTVLNYEKMAPVLDEYQSEVLIATPEHRNRWLLSQNDWSNGYSYIRDTYIKNRNTTMEKLLQKDLGAVFFPCDDEKGTVLINGEPIGDSCTIAGEQVKVKVVPNAGYTFAGLSYIPSSGAAGFITENDIFITPSSGGKYTAVFTKENSSERRSAAISASNWHILATNETGDLYGWGYSGDGQLNAVKAEADTKEPLYMLSNIKSISAGSMFSIAAKDDGSVYTWGKNTAGQLGNGVSDSVITGLTQVMLENDEPLIAKSVAAGESHSLVITPNNELYGFGANNRSQINPDTTSNITTPYKIAENVIACAGGAENSYYINTEEKLYALGNVNILGGVSAGSEIRFKPAGEENPKVKSVFAGGVAAFAITEDNELYGWGWNDSKVFGNEGVDRISTPTLIATDVAAGAASRTHLLFVKTDGEVWGVGTNGYNQISKDSSNVYPPVKIMDNGETVAAGRDFSVIMTKSGSIKVLGSNAYNQHGSGFMEDGISTPMEMKRITPLSNIKVSDGVASVDVVNYTGGLRLFNFFGINYTDNSSSNINISTGGLADPERETIHFPVLNADKIMLWDDMSPLTLSYPVTE